MKSSFHYLSGRVDKKDLVTFPVHVHLYYFLVSVRVDGFALLEAATPNEDQPNANL